MEQLDIQLKNLQQKIQLMLKQNQLLIKQNNALQKENESLKSHLAEKENLLKQMKEQTDLLKLNSNALDETEKKELRKRIDVYLAEIEKCLALLNE